jgi:hypothetical protein
MSSSSIINLDLAPLGESCHKPGDSGQTLRATGQAPYSSKAKNCAECRRLKVKCDRKVSPNSLFLIINEALSSISGLTHYRPRQVPCQNCLKRGCPSICPDSVLVARGNKYVLSLLPKSRLIFLIGWYYRIRKTFMLV